MKRISTLALLVIMAWWLDPSPGRARDTVDGASGGSPESTEAGLSALTGLSAVGAASLDRFLDTAVADGRIPAAVAFVARDAEVLWSGSAGEMTPGIPMRPDAILPLASVGKMFTATALMILVERGVVALDDPVARFIPEFAEAVVQVAGPDGATSKVAAERAMTVHHLLTHTSGLAVTGEAFWEIWDRHVGRTTTTHFARDLVAMPLRAQPGERFEYGQTGAAYEVLGAVIEIASGQTLEAFMIENLFEPLGLDDTHFYLPPEKSERLPAVYRRVDGELELDRPQGEDFSRSTFFHGGGGVRSAPRDIHRFARLFLDAGEVDRVRILEAESVASMMRDQLGAKAPDRWKAQGRSWGYGAAVVYSEGSGGDCSLESYGWVGGGFAVLWVDPGKRLVAYLCFPLTPPGDNALLAEFGDLVRAAVAR